MCIFHVFNFCYLLYQNTLMVKIILLMVYNRGMALWLFSSPFWERGYQPAPLLQWRQTAGEGEGAHSPLVSGSWRNRSRQSTKLVPLNGSPPIPNREYNITVRYILARAHKNGWLEYECVTPIEASSLGKIIESY